MLQTRQNDNVVNQVFKTKDYNKFKFLSGNRPLKTSHLKRLKASFEARDLEVPIVVNEKLEIIDGQHRYEVQKELGFPIVYVVKKGYGLKEVHTLNTSRKNWGIKEFMNSYADLGMEEYVRYREFWKKYKFGHKETLQMLLGLFYTPGSNWVEPFMDGKFKIKNLEKAEESAEKILMVKEFYPFGYRRRMFVLTMLRLFSCPEYNHTEFLSKLRYQRTRLEDEKSVNEFLKSIDEIYNYRRQGKKISFYWELRTSPQISK